MGKGLIEREKWKVVLEEYATLDTNIVEGLNGL